MLKYLIIALIIVLLLYSPMLRRERGNPSAKTPTPRPPQREAEQMLQCAHCGVHLPEGDALRDEQGRPYCSPAHRRAGPAAR